MNIPWEWLRLTRNTNRPDPLPLFAIFEYFTLRHTMFFVTAYDTTTLMRWQRDNDGCEKEQVEMEMSVVSNHRNWQLRPQQHTPIHLNPSAQTFLMCDHNGDTPNASTSTLTHEDNLIFGKFYLSVSLVHTMRYKFDSFQLSSPFIRFCSACFA